MRAVLITLLFLVVLAAAARPRFNQLEGYTFEKYVRDFNKKYERGSAEYQKRATLFHAKLAEVKAFNAEPGHSYHKGINHMSDWTVEERRGINGAIPHFPALGSKAQKLHVRGVNPLPVSVDYRTANPAILTAVKNQGMCGSCWAHAATESIETHWAIATGELYVLSQQQINSCTPNPDQCGGTGGCGGNIAEQAFDYITEHGIAEEWTYPYLSFHGNTPACYPKNQTFPVAAIAGYTKVRENDAGAVMDALANAGPLAISVDASQWSDYEGGVYNGCNYAKNISMDHAVQLVGYGHDYSLNMDYWIVRNSWSPSWGELGFIRLQRQAQSPCGWNVNPQNGNGCKGQTAPQWACGMCGLAFDTIYPNPAPPLK